MVRMAILCLLITGVLYGWTADFPMVFDDLFYLVENPFFQSNSPFVYWGNFTDFARLPFECGAEPDLTVNMLLRPLAYATFYLNHTLDGFEPRWFRVFNMLLHALNGWLFYCLIRRLGRVLESQGKMTASSARFIATGASLLFIVHPLATESVTYIIQRFTTMGASFVLTCLLLHFTAMESADRRRFWLATGSVIALLLGMLTKESVFMAPALALGLDWLVIGTRFWAATKRTLYLLLCMPLVPLMIIAVSAAQNEGQLNFVEALNITNVRGKPWSHWEYAATQSMVLLEYLRLIVWPSGQNVYPDPTVYHSFKEGPVWLAMLLLGSILGCTWCLRNRTWMSGAGRLMFAFIAWFFVSISVSSSFIPLPDMMAEHRTYLPSIGVLVMLMCIADRLSAISGIVPWRLLVIGVFCNLSVATCLRNKTWRTNVSLWQDAVTKSPNKPAAWNNLGCALIEEKGDLEKAEIAFRRALELEPFFFGALNNLSKTLLMQQRWRECHDSLVTLFERHPSALNNRQIVYWAGVALVGMGRHQEGAIILERILNDDPSHFLAAKFLGLACFYQKHFARARECLLLAEKLQPGDPDVMQALAMLKRQGVSL